MDLSESPIFGATLNGIAERDLFASIRATRFPQAPTVCPRCGGIRRIQKWGTFSGRQRYRCLSCGRTFSDLTGTVLAHSKRPGAWILFLHELGRAESVRATAARIGVHRDTVFRWRHRFLSLLRTHDLTLPAAAVQRGEHPASAFLEFLVPHSLKGQRRRESPRAGSYGRPARSHGVPHGRRPLHGRVSVLLLDFLKSGVAPIASVSSKPSRTRLSPPALAADLAPLLRPGTTLLALPHERVRLQEAVSLLPLRLRDRGSSKSIQRRRLAIGTIPGPWLRRMRSYWCRFLRWLTRFRGVASRYLVHYLHWYRSLVTSSDVESDFLRLALRPSRSQ